jgi:hypothetical protein
MSFKRLDALFQPTERNALLTDLLKPKGHCTSCDLHSKGDVSVPLPCDFQGIPPDRFKQWVENLVALSNLDGNGDLRDALRTMWKGDSLQSCVMQAIFITANNQVVTEHELRLAKTYGLTLNKTDEHVSKARKELKKVKRSIDAKGEGLSRGPAIKRFGLYQRALRDVADATLTALEQIYECEKAYVSVETIKTHGKFETQQGLEGFVCPLSPHKPRWKELAILFEAGTAIFREPDPKKCKRLSPKAGSAFGQFARRLKRANLEQSNKLLSYLEPGLYSLLETAQTHEELSEAMRIISQSEPRLPEICSYVIALSLNFVRDPIYKNLKDSRPVGATKLREDPGKAV